MLKGMLQEIVVVLLAAVLVMLLLLLVQVNVHGNSSTASKLATARNIKLQGAVSGNANFDGSENIIIKTSQANITVIEGNVKLAASTTELAEKGEGKLTTFDLNFPDGFNKENSILLSFGGKVMNDGRGYSDGVPVAMSNAMVNGNTPRSITLGGAPTSDIANKIRCLIKNYSTTEVTYYYRIVLMKIS